MTTRIIRLFAGASLALLMTSALVCVPGCRAPEETRTTARDRPLAVDPTDRVDMTGWWTNGQELLHINRDGLYLLYSSAANLDVPLHRGRWDHRTNNRLMLEPYTEFDVEPLAAEIIRHDNEYILRVPGYADFRSTIAPRREPMETEPTNIRPMSNTA